MPSIPANSNSEPTGHQLLLDVHELSVCFRSDDRTNTVVDGVSFDLRSGEFVALVGESGSGKSVTALSILQLLDYRHASHPAGEIRYRGDDIRKFDEKALRNLRGDRIAMIFQEPMTSLNPLHTVEKQIGETLLLHKGLKGTAAKERIIELLELVGIPDAPGRLSSYPHQLSGGQKQRVMIAMALANEPDVLIADEPTTALDVTVQKQVLELLRSLQKRLGMALLFITHDLSIVRSYADRVVVMQQGRVVEKGDTQTVFDDPQHPYTRKLLAADNRGEPVVISAGAQELLKAKDLVVEFNQRKSLFGRVKPGFTAVNNVSLNLRQGETLGVVGESGSGKTTLGLALLKLVPSKGAIWLNGKRIDGLDQNAFRPYRETLQVVFQDPYGSLSPRMSVAEIIGEGLGIHGVSKPEQENRIIQALEDVGLDPLVRHRYPHEFSGGQRQRVAIARALVLQPELIILDEPTSALDRTVQAQVVGLLRELQRKYRLSYLFISHDLAVVRALSHRVLVLKDGRVVEQGETEALFSAPAHPYTRELLDAALFYQAQPD
ncbi:ABC transporter ATP-binding protein [Hydrocarboniclastica marina]|uniref:ABC transporter ATP-binding protein n=1 Tax=Hydrocarboniclastica marina TaxID=2259620 RepID=A0A4V1D8S3_9ALTE|nr:ABC transporter ATP-binding protein [Hydrocarboniclastica marina]QCF26190.1 ABC transporter ATP-binding protein [Hydrocarboniclastica marina]